ncbi:hypothetical protein [Sphingorhabdus sp. Alg239-R122]|uniref:hypothetical protein n=1 Tax=Sphingorhabdus sp. Alg239-R122 TaxID=2305989 RepID=UPI0013D8E5FC|nr:hypothetical protein [Sphingorhabdus sp. Alg239-R122]
MMLKKLEYVGLSLILACASGALAQAEGDTQASSPAIINSRIADEPPLPELPATPVLTDPGYPECREDYRQFEAPYDQAKATNLCTEQVDKYYHGVLLPFRRQLITHQEEIAKIYLDKVGGNSIYSPATQERFYTAMMKEHADSDTEGVHMADYRAAYARYQDDRAYLQDRFCFNTGCGGYPKPDYTPKTAEDDDRKPRKAKKSVKSDKCGKSRKRGSLLGGILGGVAGDAAGLGNVGSLLASGVSGILVGEIACQLTKDEQEEAAKATVEVTKKERVGATASWQSPTRAGVSGSSTVTALNTQPNGAKCLNITDVAIIDGEETRVQKRMCREKGNSGYSIVV